MMLPITRCDGFRLKNQISAKDATIAELREENARLEMAGGILASTIASERTGQAPDGADWYWGDIWDAAKKGAKDIRAEQAK